MDVWQSLETGLGLRQKHHLCQRSVEGVTDIGQKYKSFLMRSYLPMLYMPIPNNAQRPVQLQQLRLLLAAQQTNVWREAKNTLLRPPCDTLRLPNTITTTATTTTNTTTVLYIQ